jgi:hypothetical protein
VLGVLSVLLVVSDTVGRQAILAVLGRIAAGMVLVAIPVCAFYAAHGQLGRFIELYLLVPRAVAAGYSNTRFPNTKYTLLFYGLPLLLGALLLAALLTSRPLRVANHWTDRRVVLVSAITAALISHLGALTRSDAPHLGQHRTRAARRHLHCRVRSARLARRPFSAPPVGRRRRDRAHRARRSFRWRRACCSPR